LQRQGVDAVGLSGIDGRVWEGARKAAITVIENGKKKVLRDDHTGKVEKVNLRLLQVLLKQGYTPVLTPPAISYEGEAINVDGDRAAAMLAAALEAEKLIILSNVPGLLKDLTDESSLITEIRLCEMQQYVGYAQGRMKKKMLGAVEAIRDARAGVFADARIENPITEALKGKGTVIH
jgi:acetylglutamate/LysW-gamma-L-alpha-aminoadipate kinase